MEQRRRARIVQCLLVVLVVVSAVLGVRVYEQSRALSYLRSAHAETEVWYEQDRDHRSALNQKRVEAIASLRSDLATAKQALVRQRARKAAARRISLKARRPPAIEAKVVAVKADITPALVVLSVGSKDKVQKGFEFTIYRDKLFVAKVVVEHVLKDNSGCRVLFTAEGEAVFQGDRAATLLQ